MRGGGNMRGRGYHDKKGVRRGSTMRGRGCHERRGVQ